jgi:hypothetical protein
MATIASRLTNTGTLLVNGTIDEVTYNIANPTIKYTQALDTSSYWYQGTAATVAANVAIAPDGTLTADKIVQTTTNARHGLQSPTLTVLANTAYTLSGFAKAAENNFVSLIYGKSGSPYTRAGSTVDLTTGAVTNYNNGTPTSVTRATPISVGNGWWFIYLTVIIDATSTDGYVEVNTVNSAANQSAGYTGANNTDGTYVWGLQLEQNTVVTDYQPIGATNTLVPGPTAKQTSSTIYTSNGFDEVTFNPSSVAAAIKNLLTYSQQFDNAAWTKTSGLTIIPNSTLAPDGTLTADTVTGNGVSTGYLERSYSYTTGVTYVFSVYAKANTTSTINILLYGTNFNSGSTNVGRQFTLSNGTTTTLGGTVNPSSYGIIDCGNGWYRCWIVQTATQTASSSQQFVRMTGLSDSVYLWGYQLEVGTAPTIYQPIAAANTLENLTTVRKADKNGDYYIQGSYDEWTGAPVVDSSVKLWIDAGQTTSYSGTGTTWSDISGNSNNGTLNNSPTYASIGAITFNGTSQYADITNPPSLNLGTGDYSISGWIYITQSVTATGRILTFSTASYTLAGDILIDTTSVLKFSSRDGTGTDNLALVSITSADQNKWLFFTAIRSAKTPVIYLYDGSTVRTNTGTASATVMDLTTPTLVRLAMRPASSIHYFGGSIAQLQIYNRALTSDEVAQNFNALRRRYGI